MSFKAKLKSEEKILTFSIAVIHSAEMLTQKAVHLPEYMEVQYNLKLNQPKILLCLNQ